MKGGDRTQCWPWKGSYGHSKTNNWPQPLFRCNGRLYAAHRMVLHLVDPTFNIDDRKDLVRHKCDNKGVIPYKEICCNPAHLEHGSHAQNMQDMIDRERHGLPHHVVRYIRKLLNDKDDEGKPMYTHAQIARKYGVSRQTVTAIGIGARYAKVTEHSGSEEFGAEEQTHDGSSTDTSSGRNGLRPSSSAAFEEGNGGEDETTRNSDESGGTSRKDDDTTC